MAISYPILNISLPDWNGELVNEIFLDDDQYQTKDENFIQEYIIGHKFVDCTGNVYKIVNRSASKINWWQSLFNVKKGHFIFHDTGEKMTFDELKNMMVDKIQRLDWKGGQEDWLKAIKTARTIQELIKG